MHITRVDIKNVPPLGIFSHPHYDVGIADFDCDKRVNLFVGPNASGKSTILRAMNRLNSSPLFVERTPHSHFIFRTIQGAEGSELVAGVCLEVSDDWPRDADRHVEENAVPVLYIPAIRAGIRGGNIFDPIPARVENYAIGSPSPLSDLFDTDSGAFYGQHVESAVAWLRVQMIQSRIKQNQFRRAIDIGYSCTKSVCSEVLYDASPHPFLEVDAYEDSRTVHYGMGIGTSDDILGEPLYAGALSLGTQGTLLWIYALTLKMAHHYNWEENWEEKPAILLIDEIENHLHPTWQRRVIPALLEHFPQLQIFATTHSPFVVAGLKAGQVHLLHRDPETGSVTASTYTEDIIGWTADEILRNMMGVDEPTDQLTVDRADRLRQLREKETLTPDEEAELNGLRRQVNETFLTKVSPLEHQRERFADLMQRFLASRESDLTQDGI